MKLKIETNMWYDKFVCLYPTPQPFRLPLILPSEVAWQMQSVVSYFIWIGSRVTEPQEPKIAILHWLEISPLLHCMHYGVTLCLMWWCNSINMELSAIIMIMSLAILMDIALLCRLEMTLLKSLCFSVFLYIDWLFHIYWCFVIDVLSRRNCRPYLLKRHTFTGRLYISYSM